jgi:hypothetical protein
LSVIAAPSGQDVLAEFYQPPGAAGDGILLRRANELGNKTNQNSRLVTQEIL